MKKKAKKRKVSKAEGKISEKELDRELDEIEEKFGCAGESKKDVKVKASKNISKVKKGDKMKVDGVEYEVDAHYVLIDHGKTREMAIEVFDKNEKDYQIRYFNDRIEGTIDFYELQGEIMFVKKQFSRIEW